MASDNVYVQLLGVTSMNQLTASQQTAIPNTIITQMNVGGTASLMSSGNTVHVVIDCPPVMPPAALVPHFNYLKNIIYAHVQAIHVPICTGLGDATDVAPDGGDTGGGDGGDTGGGDGGDTGGGDGGDTGGGDGGDTGGGDGGDTGGGNTGGGGDGGDTGDEPMVSSQLLGISAFNQLTSAELNKITVTIIGRLNIGSIGGSCSLSEDTVYSKVIATIVCPPQIPPTDMINRFNNSKADLLAHINWPTPIVLLTGLSDAYTATSGPSGPKVRFQLTGVLALKILAEETVENVCSTTANILNIPIDHISIIESEGGVYAQVVAPPDQTIQGLADQIKRSKSSLSEQLSALSPNINGISTPQATTSDLGIEQEKPKITVPVQGITSTSQFVNGVAAAEYAVSLSIGLPASNVEIQGVDGGGVMVVLTPTDTISADRIMQLLPTANITYILQNQTNGLVTGTDDAGRHVTSKIVSLSVQELNTHKMYQLSVDTASTLGDFKTLVQQHTGMSPGDQVLALGGTQILDNSDDTTLGEVGIVADGFMIGVFSTKYEPPVWGTFTPPSDYKIVGYYAAWGVYMRQFFLSGVDVTRLTHLNYAFANIKNGEVVIGDDWADPKNFDMLDYMKEKNPHMKTLISVGGWTWSTGFSNAAMTSSGRAKFARSAVKLMNDYHFDGIDIDWEFPVQGGDGSMSAHQSPQDKTNCTLLMQALRNEMGNNKLLTMAVTPNPYYYVNYEIKKLADICDWINLMAYDYNGAWPGCNESNFNAPLFHADNDPGDPRFNIHSSVQELLDQGLPRQKLVVGLSFYGRGFNRVSPGPAGNGLYQPYSGRPYGTWPDEFDEGSGVYDYYDLRDNYIGKGDWQAHYLAEAEAAWLYSPSKQIFIGYDDPTTIWAKCAYIISRGLGGGMIWDLSMDRGNQLLYTVHEALQPDGTDVSGAKDAVPKSASGSNWNDQNIASGKINCIKFRFDENRVYGIQVLYDNGTTSDWHGSSTSGRLVYLDIPANIGIDRVDVFVTSGSPKLIQALGFVYTNGTSTIIGTQHSRESDTYYMRVPFGAIISHFKGKADGSGLTQINSAFKAIPGHDFTRSSSEEEFLKNMITTESGERRRLKDFYLAKGKIEVQPEKLQEVASQSRSSARSGAPPEVEGGMQFRIKAGGGDWLIGYGPRLETSPEGGFIVEYAIRSYPGVTGVVIGDEDDPDFKFSWTAPVYDISTGGGIIVKDGAVSISGSILGQGGTLTISDHGVAFAGTIGNVTFDTAIGADGLKFFATTANGLFGGGLEIGPNKFAIGITFFGFSLYLDIGAIIRGEISLAEIGLALLKGMLQIALGFLKTMVKCFVALFTFGLVWLDI